MDILIGADPEIFVKDSDGNLVSAYGMIPGTKKEPHKVRGGAVQVDGMALEFNIEPAKDIDEFEDNIELVMEHLKDMLPEGHTFAIQPTADFGRELIDAQPEEARALGCEPDFNAYTVQENPRPNADAPFRTASGHIHIGWTQDEDPFDPDHFEACRMLTKQLDILLAVPSLLWDYDTKRRELYGALGAFRPKPYGVEYRVLSNAWLTNPLLIEFVYKQTMYATNRLLEGRKDYESFGAGQAKKWFDSNSVQAGYDIATGYTFDHQDGMYRCLGELLRTARRVKDERAAQKVKSTTWATKAEWDKAVGAKPGEIFFDWAPAPVAVDMVVGQRLQDADELLLAELDL
jgi:hypothetical protein